MDQPLAQLEKGNQVALIRSLNTAVSGLRAQQFRIEVIGNNIANVDTTAFKNSRVDFASMLSQSLTYGVAPQGFLGGIDPIQVGLGTQVGSTATDFSQGPTEATGVATDIAIQGDGFFTLRDQSGGAIFTRDGSFSINPSNLLHDAATGFVVQGYMADENFRIVTGGVLENIEIPVGVATIARPTTEAFFSGNLNSGGSVASEGTLLRSDVLYDNRTTNSDLISADNPLGLVRATATTPLQNLVRSLGDFVTYTATDAGSAATAVMLFPELANQLTGVEIQLQAMKGERELPTARFVVGDPPPTGGTTLGDFMQFVQNRLGINDGSFDDFEQTEDTLSYARTNPVTGEEVNGTLSAGVAGGLDDVASLGHIIDRQADFRGVQAGDFIRFTAGASAGQIAQITSVSASSPGGSLDTLTFRTDGFNSLTIVPAFGDTYAVHARADVGVPPDVTILDLDGGAPTVAVSAPATNGGIRSFTITDSSVTSFPLEQGLSVNQLVQYTAGGTTVSGRVASVVGNAVTVAFDATLAQDPDVGTSFRFLEQANGTIEIAGNVGSLNDISNIEILSEGARIPLFDNPPVVNAAGESVTLTSTVYDSLGTPRQVELTLVFQGSSPNGPNVWRYFAESNDDSDLDRVVGSGTILFSASGQYLATGEPTETMSINLDATPEQGGGVVTPFNVQLDFSRLTQFATPVSEIQLQQQDGFEAGTLREFAVNDNGIIEGIFSNGLTRNLGQIALTRFANPNGLNAEGDNMFRVSVNSGPAQTGVPGSFGRGTLRSGFLEESNVDLAQQFTDLIVGQRAFQANARTVTVSDEMLQELVNLI
ncbi:MAG: flagellar hook-basal body complex protein [Planctomycetota bacterium]